MGKQNKNIFDCQGGDFSLKSLDDSFDAEDGEWYPDNSDETDLVLAASLCKNNAVKKEKKKKKGKKKEKRTQENNPLKKLFKYDEKKEDDLESEDEEIERTERSQSKYHPMYEMAHALEEFCDLKVVDGEVYYYENTYYMHLTKDQIIELYKLRVDPKLHGAVNLRNYRDLYDYIKMEQILKYEMPKNEKLYCPFENGILFVKKGRFEDHDPEFVTFTCLNAKYNEDVESPEEADCPVFDKFMKEISGGRKDIEERLWMALGYLLVEPARGKFFFIMGYARDSGKSIWGNFVQKLFPEEAISNLSLRELGGKFETESLLDKGFIKPQSEYPDAYTDTFYISQKLSNSTGNSILDVLNDAFSDGSSEWVGYKGGFFSYNDDACVLVTAKGMSFSESGDYSLTYVESGKTTTLTDSRGFEQEADIYYAYNTDEFSEAYENLNTVDNEIADESSLIFEFLIGNENYTDWQ